MQTDAGLRDGGLERIKVHHHEINRFDFMFLDRFLVFLVTADIKQSAMDLRMQCLHSAVEHFGKIGVAAQISNEQTFIAQDFGGAAAYVLSHRAEGDPIVTAGAATFPYRDYYRQPWSAVTSPADVEAIRAQGQPVWVLYTLADYLAAGAPRLMKMLRDDCRVEKVFRGTVAGGDVTVCVFAPTRAPAAVPPQ